ncbi:hypothetical protein SOV_52450 [Sporomusa ovata DSM 2662]|uniref:DNA repair protein RadC n=1 Tax=Sporomusa ovata TaxID=2378 RepID=A0A0U1KS36_9FIRM|nr:DNA repair protein RadC [Sporomusa ovata]EQB27617.1 DNA repair protein RadC [Sporomusa ovata DSM 2662]CQR69969.1 DNA repair protein RadC [Sporomusa ovata]
MSRIHEKITPLEYLSEETLLSEFVSPEVAKLLIAEHSSIYNLLLHTSELQWENISGMGKAKVKRLAYIKAILNRIEAERQKQVNEIKSPQDVAAFCADMQDLLQEEFRVVFLNTKNKVLGQKQIFVGTVDSSLVSSREVFYAAVQHMAVNIIIVHNHPSGNPAPSREDIECTQLLVKAGNILRISVLDHVIIGKNGYCSLKAEGYIPVKEAER